MSTFPRSIAYICTDPGVPVFGTKGCSVHVQEVLRTFLKTGAKVSLFAQRFGGEVPAALQGVELYQLPALDKSSTQARERSALANNAHLLALLEETGPFDLVYERYALWGLAGMRYAKTCETAGILEVNAPLIQEQKEHRVLIHEREANSVFQSVLSDASALIAVSDAVGRHLAAHAPEPGKIHVIPNGVDPARFSPARCASFECKPGVFTVGFVGTLKPWHGVLDLVDAFALLHRQVPESRLLLVGDGPERQLIASRLVGHNLVHATHFTGAVHPDAVPSLIAAMDVCVAPYPRLENCYFSPLKAFEYMASGKAFIGSDTGQLADVIDNGRDGLLYPAGDVARLGQLLHKLYKDPAMKARLGHAARETVLKDYTWDSVGRRILRIAGEQQVYEVA